MRPLCAAGRRVALEVAAAPSMVHMVWGGLGGLGFLSFFHSCTAPGPTRDPPTPQLKTIGSWTSTQVPPLPGTSGYCDIPLADVQCPPSNLSLTGAVVLVVLVVAYTLLWGWWLWQAQRDHRLLPYQRYK